MHWIIENQIYIFLGVVAAVILFLGWMIFDLRKKVALLLGTGNQKNSSDLLQDFLRRITHIETKMEETDPRLDKVEEVAGISVQKVGFLRFNPFADMGGDNSFVLALLDHENNGVIISSLYMRDGARVYAKKIDKGIAQHSLSEEEKRTLDNAINGNINRK